MVALKKLTFCNCSATVVLSYYNCNAVETTHACVYFHGCIIHCFVITVHCHCNNDCNF